MKSNKTYRLFISNSYFGVICTLSFFALLPFFLIIWSLFQNGTEQLNFAFFTEGFPSQIDIIWAHLETTILSGGILNGILGTLYMLCIALIIAIPLGILTGIYLHDNWNNKFTLVLRYFLAILNGMPSIIIGMVAYLWIARPFHSFSALAGGISLAIIMYPMMVQYMKEILWKIPLALRESGFALGLNYTSTIFQIILPIAKNGILASIFFTISKAIGITTPLIITALGTSIINWDLLKPTSSISLLIWNFFNNPNLTSFMWTSALFLTILVILFNSIAKYIYWKWKKNLT